MHVWTIDVHVELKLLTNILNVLESFLVVWPGSTDPNLDLVLVKQRCDFTKGTDDALESRSDLRRRR